MRCKLVLDTWKEAKVHQRSIRKSLLTAVKKMKIITVIGELVVVVVVVMVVVIVVVVIVVVVVMVMVVLVSAGSCSGGDGGVG